MAALKKISSFLTIISFTLLMSCVKNEVTSITLDKTTLSINVGQSDSITTTVALTGDITKQPVTWSASDPKIVTLKGGAFQDAVSKTNAGTITQKIIITALSAGTTNITIQVGDKNVSVQVVVSQKIYNFTQALASNWGDYYETGKTSNFDLYLLEKGLSVDTAGNLTGAGTYLYLDFNVPITQEAIQSGNYILANTGDVNTFFPGQIVQYQNQSYVVGTRIVTVDKAGSTLYLIKDGHYSISAIGGNFVVEGDITTITNEVIRFTYTGVISVTDKREQAVEIYPSFTKGRLYYFGDAYNSTTSNNFVALLGTKDVNFADSTLNGEMLMLEINTSLSVKDSIPSGTYTAMSELTTANLIPYSLVPGYTDSNGNNWGSWYYGKTFKKIKTGNIAVSKSGSQYTINYELYDRVGSKISGTYSATLDYIDGTASSAVGAVKVKRASSASYGKNLSDIQKRTQKFKPFGNLKRLIK